VLLLLLLLQQQQKEPSCDGAKILHGLLIG
jgi:hypothetical protein